MDVMCQDFMTIKDLSVRSGLPRRRLYALIRAGELPSLVLGGVIRVPRSSYEEWLAVKSAEALSKR